MYKQGCWDSRLTGQFDLIFDPGFTVHFAQTNGIVERTGGYFVRNLSYERLLSAALYMYKPHEPRISVGDVQVATVVVLISVHAGPVPRQKKKKDRQDIIMDFGS